MTHEVAGGAKDCTGVLETADVGACHVILVQGQCVAHQDSAPGMLTCSHVGGSSQIHSLKHFFEKCSENDRFAQCAQQK